MHESPHPSKGFERDPSLLSLQIKINVLLRGAASDRQSKGFFFWGGVSHVPEELARERFFGQEKVHVWQTIYCSLVGCYYQKNVFNLQQF